MAEAVEEALDAGVMPTTLDLLVARAQFSGELALGYRIRAQQARHQAAQPLTGSGAGRLRSHVAALIAQGRPGAARTLAVSEAERAAVTPAAAKTSGGRGTSAASLSASAWGKIVADAALADGDADPLRSYAERLDRSDPLHGQRRMAELVRGRRVAVVGPSATAETFGADIDAHDLVVRPNFQPEVVAANAQMLGSRTDITYYSGQDLQRAQEEVRSHAEDGGLKMVVGRPFSHQAVGDDPPPWLRLMRHEYGLHFRGTPQGISRIVYDLMQFAPKEIVLYNVDFYSGASAYAAGYRSPVTEGPGSSFLNDMLVVHDLRAEFELMQSFRRTGLFTGRGVVEEVLNLGAEEYVQLLQTRSVLARPEGAAE